MIITILSYVGTDTSHFIPGMNRTVLGYVDISGILNAVMIDQFGKIALSGDITNTSLWIVYKVSEVTDSVTAFPIGG